MFAIRRFAFENTYKDTDQENNKVFIFVKPHIFQRSYCLLLCIQKLLEEDERDIEIFMILHKLERHGKPHMSLSSQYESLSSSIKLLNDIYPNHHILYHKVKWYDEDPGNDVDLSWNEETIMKDYDLPIDKPKIAGIDVAGIFNKQVQDNEYKSSLYSDIGWIEGQDGFLHKYNYMVDIESGQR